MLVYDKEEPVTDNLITWVFDENSFVPAAKLVGDKSYSILTDHLGTPYEAYDENGEKVWIVTAVFDLFGEEDYFFYHISDKTGELIRTLDGYGYDSYLPEEYTKEEEKENLKEWDEYEKEHPEDFI